TLALGYLVYDFSEKNAAANEARKKAEETAKANEASLQKEKEAKLIYKTALGLLNDADRTDMSGLRYKTETKAVYDDMMKALGARADQAITGEAGKFVGKAGGFGMKATDILNWQWQSADQSPSLPPKGLIDNSVSFYSQRQLAEASYAVELQGIAEAKKKMNELSVTLDNAKKNIDARQAQIPEEIGKEIAKVKAEFEEIKKKFQAEEQNRRNDLAKKDDEIGKIQQEAKRAVDVSDRLKDANKQLSSQLDSKLDPFQFDKPQGRVIRRTGNIVEIDLGSADFLRPGLTFSIMPSDTPQRGFEARLKQFRENGTVVTRIVPKGSIEVVEILGANLSQCRITDEDSQVRDRILTGDLLYNSVWRKGSSEHIVLYG
ncbi:MAG: hypothetical protein ACRCZF_04085, partial [Gemmataceae bacterium]